MEYRLLGRTGYKISTVSFGAWAIGGQAWGGADDAESLRALHKAVDLGVNFFDTADVYGDGRSEKLLARLRRERQEPLVVATKAGRRLDPHTAAGYNRENLTAFVNRSLENLGTDALDLLQLHCPPPEVYDSAEVFGVLDDLVGDGKLLYYGISVESVEEALHGIQHPNVQSVQIIFNMFRVKPAERFFAAAAAKQVGILARVPLASGLLAGRLKADSAFGEDDHRRFNRKGERFDMGETFSGVDYATGLEAVEELRPLVPAGATPAQLALRWILMFPEVTAAIPGARSPAQVEENVRAADLPALPPATMSAARGIYDRRIRAAVHGRW
jgi:aryl-alcohol dehydrogenase-like predicted oxidoreductase